MRFLTINQIRNNRNLKNGVLYTIFSFINNGIGFILLLIIANYLTPTDYGYLNLFTNFVALMSIAIALSTSSFISVSFFQKDRDALNKIVGSVFSITTVMLLTLLLLLYSFRSVASELIGVPAIDILIGLTICYFTVFNNVNLDIWRLEEKPVTYGIYSLSFAICNFALTFLLIVEFHLGWSGRVYAWGILAAIYFVISIIFLFHRKYLELKIPPRSVIKEVLVYSLPLVPHGLSFWLKSGIDRYIINYFYDQSVVGLFSFAANLAAIINIFGTAFNASNSVNIYKSLSNGYSVMRNSLRKQTMLMTFFFVVICMSVVLLALGIIHWILVGYIGSSPYVLPLCIGAFFQCLYLLWVNYLFYYKKTRQLMYITFCTALLQVGLSLIFTRYSPLYTAYVSMFISALTMALVYLISKRTLKKEYEKESYTA